MVDSFRSCFPTNWIFPQPVLPEYEATARRGPCMRLLSGSTLLGLLQPKLRMQCLHSMQDWALGEPALFPWTLPC